MRDDVGLAGYTPLEAGSMSELEPFEREMVEVMRRDLWRRGVRDPRLTKLAFELAGAACLSREL